jgi:hypothetical protein
MIRTAAAWLALLLCCASANAQNVPISQLPQGTLPLTGSEPVPLVQSGTTKRVPSAAIGLPIVATTPPTAVGIGQSWINTATTPATLAIWDGSNWVPMGTLDMVGHGYTPNAALAVEANLTAAGNSQGTALALRTPYGIHTVLNVSSGTGVELPAAAAGRVDTVHNAGANPLLVYPPSGVGIDALGTNAPLTIEPGTSIIFRDDTASQIRTSAIPNIAAGANVSISNANGVTTISAPAPSVANAVSTNTTLSALYETWPCNAAAGNVTLTVPLGSANVNQEFDIKKVDSTTNTCTVVPSGSDTIDGQTSQIILHQYDDLTIKNANGASTWYIQ